MRNGAGGHAVSARARIEVGGRAESLVVQRLRVAELVGRLG